MRRPKTTHASPSKRSGVPQNQRLPFIEHLYELRKRLFYVALSVGLWAAAAYSVQQKIVAVLLKPAHHQQFIYTSVGGGIDFLFRVCIYAGVAFSIPVIVFQMLRYVAPLIKQDARRFIAWGSVISGFLAVGGMLFGYFIGLPAALHFLLNQFTTDQIHPLLTIQSYMSFVSIYMFGSALLFQLPLIIVIINRIKPLQPKKLFRYERWVILLAFVGGGLMNPSPRLQDQLLLSVPVIITYQIGIGIVWFVNRRKHRRSPKLEQLLERDAKARAERLARFQAAQHQAASAKHSQPSQPALVPKAALFAKPLTPRPPAPIVVAASLPIQPQPGRSMRYLNDFTGRRTAYSRGSSSAA